MKRADIVFSYRWEELPRQEIGRVVHLVRDECASSEEAARRLGWHLAEVTRYMNFAPVQEFAGDHVFSLTEENLRKHSFKQLEMMVKRAAVRILTEELGSIRSIAHFIQKDSKYVSWLLG